MALHRKYAALPDLDSAPDIYETPELTDDNSTVPGTTLDPDDDREEIDDDESGISQPKLRIDDARSRFERARYNSVGVDFSDRVDVKRKSYKASSRRQMLEDGGEEIGDLSDEEDMESLERKIARLKREVEEAKEEYGRKKATAASTPKVDNDELTEEGLASLGEVLESLSLPAGHTRVMAGTITDPTKTAAQSSAAGVALDEPTYTVTYAPSYEQTHALVKTAEFENRLLMLEKAIGATSAALDVDLNGLPRAIVPTLDVLQRQISTLAQASTATLDPISRRVRNLTQEAEQLARARKDAKEQNDQFLSEKEKANKENSSSNEEQDAKINALYGTLATIENLAPLLPPLLDRLRSLRAIHADAAMANETLDRIAKQQMDMATELKQWREGLEKIEGAMKEGNAVMEGNMKVMDSWVKDLEARMVKLS